MRFTKNVFTVLAICMIGFGILIGFSFPFFTMLMGVPKRIVICPLFFSLCIIAGIIVGAVNIILASVIVRNRLKKVSNSMISVKNHLDEAVAQGDRQLCSSEGCYLVVDSNDEFGETSNAFNQLLKAFEESLRTQNAFRAYNKTLTSQLQLDTLTSNSLIEIISYTNSCAGAIYVVKSGKLELHAAECIESAEKLMENELLLKVLKTKKSKVVNLPDDIIIDKLLALVKPKNIIIEPLVYKDISLGIIVLASFEYFSQQIKNHIDVFSNSLALALNNSLEHSQLQTLVALDPLTGMYNRRFGNSRLCEEYDSATRTGTPLGVLMFDIDEFKKVNDTFGHIAGDRVLVEITHMTKSILRKHDISMRYGGEEFIAILPGASTHETLVVANRLRELVDNSLIQYGDSQIHVTISIGLVSQPETVISNAQELINYADIALYKAKSSGKNKVMLHNQIEIA